jgi:hypothetical protein
MVYFRQVASGRHEWWLGWLTDVSRSGIGLVVTNRVEPGRVIELEVHDLERHGVRVCRLTVQHVTAVADDCWLVGGHLQQPESLEGWF